MGTVKLENRKDFRTIVTSIGNLDINILLYYDSTARSHSHLMPATDCT